MLYQVSCCSHFCWNLSLASTLFKFIQILVLFPFSLVFWFLIFIGSFLNVLYTVSTLDISWEYEDLASYGWNWFHTGQFFCTFQIHNGLTPICWRHFFTHIFQTNLFETGHFQNLSTWQFQFFCRPKPLWLGSWMIFTMDLPWQDQPRLVLVVVGQGRSGFPTKSHHFSTAIFREAGLSGSFLCLETWDRGLGWLRAQLGEEKPFFFKGKNYSGFNMIYWSKRRVYHYVCKCIFF